ncbi:MAG: hypothetical protein WCB90_13660, partial [Methanosarcina sp.]
ALPVIVAIKAINRKTNMTFLDTFLCIVPILLYLLYWFKNSHLFGISRRFPWEKNSRKLVFSKC